MSRLTSKSGHKPSSLTVQKAFTRRVNHSTTKAQETTTESVEKSGSGSETFPPPVYS